MKSKIPQTELFNYLNNYQFKDIDEIKYYIKNKSINPEFEKNLSEYQIRRFKTKYKNFQLIDNKIYYVDNLHKLEVVEKDNIEDVLEDLYSDFKTFGLGIDSFYNNVRQKYLNITRDEVSEFIKGKTTYQLTKKEPPKINKPIIAYYPNERWAIDLVDVKIYSGHNSQKKYILTAIDYFSRYVFASGITNKTAENTLEGLKEIIQKAGVKPTLIQADNGGEFKSVFSDYLKANNIKIVRTLSYSPSGNALIENFNNILRKYIREGFIRTNSLNWIDHLDDYLYNRNHTHNGTTKNIPADIWIPKRSVDINKDSNDPYNIKRQQVVNIVKDKAVKDLERNQSEEFESGETVRVLLSSLYSKVRAIEKAGNKKLLPVKYSPELFTVEKRIRPHQLRKARYTLLDSNGRQVLQELADKSESFKREPKLFFGTELQKVNKDSENIITTNQAIKLNRLNVPIEIDSSSSDEPEPKLKKEKKIEPTIKRETRFKGEKRVQTKFG